MMFWYLSLTIGKNLSLPKLNITKKFYKRLLWLYVFNIHVHNDDSSYFHTFLEGQVQRSSESVVSFIFDFLKQKFKYLVCVYSPSRDYLHVSSLRTFFWIVR